MEGDERTEVFEFLKNHVKMVLAINEKGGYPNASLMHYTVTPDLEIHFGTRKAFGKYQALKDDPKVSFVVIEEGLDPLRVVDGRGQAEELEHYEEELAFSLFKTKNKSKWYVEHADDFVMFKIKPTSIRWLDGSSGELVASDIL